MRQCESRKPIHTHCYDTVLGIPPRSNGDDRDFLRELGRQVVGAVMDADAYDGEERREYLRRRMRELETIHQ